MTSIAYRSNEVINSDLRSALASVESAIESASRALAEIAASTERVECLTASYALAQARLSADLDAAIGILNGGGR